MLRTVPSDALRTDLEEQEELETPENVIPDSLTPRRPVSSTATNNHVIARTQNPTQPASPAASGRPTSSCITPPVSNQGAVQSTWLIET